MFFTHSVVQVSPTSQDTLGDFFALDRRHDNPDRDGEWIDGEYI